jgi:hypothetical protein
MYVTYINRGISIFISFRSVLEVKQRVQVKPLVYHANEKRVDEGIEHFVCVRNYYICKKVLACQVGKSVLTAKVMAGYCNDCTTKHRVERINGGYSHGKGLAAPVVRPADSVERVAVAVRSWQEPITADLGEFDRGVRKWRSSCTRSSGEILS